MYRKPDWAIEGRGWPNRDASRFVEAAGLRWHVQVMGNGPVLLLLHGAGAATHSWRAFAPLLADRYTVVAPDLPGHGFTDTPSSRGLSLPGMASSVAGLMGELGVAPQIVVGHSAGAAIALRQSLDGLVRPQAIIGINGALLPFPGLAAHIFPPAAKLLFLNPLAIHLFAKRAQDGARVERLMRSTGSRIDAQGLELYGRLFRTTGHVAGVLGMMANWDLSSLKQDIPALPSPLTLFVGGNDRAVSPDVARQVAAILPRAVIKPLPDLGHLAHEESPQRVATAIRLALDHAAAG